ncbi:MAG: transposase [Blastocatellia bacterium]|nr:transposase [Blastocatellia bacterium]
MRTVKRLSLKLNTGKWEAVERFARAFASDKQTHLDFYQKRGNFHSAAGWRERRDAVKQSDHHHHTPLPVHASDLAIKEAYETELKYWASIAEQIGFRDAAWTEEQKHYANWLLFTGQRFSALIEGKAPINQQINLSLNHRKQVQNYLRRRAREIMKDRPRVRMARSFVLDNSLYKVFETAQRQGISISGLERGDRIHIPLEGLGEIIGNIRVVLLPESRRMEFHITREIKVLKAASEEVMALDVGITEVFADDEGNLYGQKMGEVLREASVKLNDKGRKRNKLHVVRKKYLGQGKKKKARNIRKYNLGGKALRERKRLAKITIENQINRATTEALKKRQPKVVVTEKLNIRGPAKSKEISRRVSYWHRRALKERIEFKASAAGCRREQVNPAYTSQVCPSCGYLDKANRQGDRFQCRKCRHAGHADVIAAINLKARMNDREITLWTPKETVRIILLERYEARLGTPECLAREDQDGDRSGADSRT